MVGVALQTGKERVGEGLSCGETRMYGWEGEWGFPSGLILLNTSASVHSLVDVGLVEAVDRWMCM